VGGGGNGEAEREAAARCCKLRQGASCGQLNLPFLRSRPIFCRLRPTT